MGYILTNICRFFETLVGSTGAHATVSVAGIMFLGFPVTFSSGAYAMVILNKSGLSIPLSVFLAILIVTGIGTFFSYAYTKLSNDSFAVLTLASIMAIDALLKSWDSVTGGVLGISGVIRPGVILSLTSIAIAQGIIALIILAIYYIVLKSSFGRSVRALKESKRTLNSLGTSNYKVGIIVIIVACILSGIEGILSIWRIQYLDPSFGSIFILLQALTIAIIAYKPKVSWLVLSALFVIVLPEFIRFMDFSSVIMGHMRVMVYSLFIIFMIKNLSRKSIAINRSI